MARETWPFYLPLIMESTDILKRVSDTTLDKPDTIKVDVQPQGKLQEILQRFGLMKKTRVFLLKPLYLGTLIRISQLVLSLEIKLPESGSSSNLLESNYKAVSEHGHTLARIVAIAIQNTEKEPSDRMIRFIVNNFTSQELVGVLTLILLKMDLKNFMTSIISVRGLNVLVSQTNAPVMPVNGNEVSL